MENIIKGGLHRLDNYDETSGRMLNLCMFSNPDLNMFDNSEKIIKTGANSSKKRTECSKKKRNIKSIIVGDCTLANLLDVNLEWNSFIKNFTDLDEKKYVENVVKILDFPKLTSYEELIQVLKKILNMDKDAHIEWMSKKFKIYNSLGYSLQSLFWALKLHFEELIRVFNTTRTKYITLHKTNDKINDYSLLLKQWKALDKEYAIDSSSIPLLFFNPPNDPEQLPWVNSIDESKKESWKNMPKFEFDISTPSIKNDSKIDSKNDLNDPKDNKNTQVSISIYRLKQALKENQFIYLGFCRCQPIKRFLALLQFPIRELLDCIKLMDKDFKLKPYCKLNDMIKKVKHPKKPNLTKIHNEIDPILKDLASKKKHKNKEKISNLKIYKIHKYVEKLLKIYTALQPYLVLLEEYYVNVSLSLNKITKNISDVLQIV